MESQTPTFAIELILMLLATSFNSTGRAKLGLLCCWDIEAIFAKETFAMATVGWEKWKLNCQEQGQRNLEKSSL